MAYVYKLTFIPTNQYYIGYRGSKTSNPMDLLTTYFTSSKVVKKLISEYGVENFKKEILAEFESGLDAYEYEQKLLVEHNVECNIQMLNKRLTSFSLGAFKNHTAKTKEKMRKSRKSLWGDENYRSKVTDAVRKSWRKDDRGECFKTEEFRDLKSRQSTELWKDPEYLEKYHRAHAEAVNSQEYKDWHSQHKKNLWKDDTYRSNMSEKRKAKWADPEYRKMMSEKRKARWSDPEYRKMMLESRKKK